MIPKTLIPLVSASANNEELPKVISGSWVTLICLIGLLVVAYASALRTMVGAWLDENANMEHGILAPVVFGLIVWQKRHILRTLPRSHTRWGIGLVAWGILQSVADRVTQGVWGTEVGFLIALIGCVWATYGFRVVRELAYPFLVLFLMIAPPQYLYERLTLKLQLLASQLGEFSLEAIGYSVLREGNVLELVGEKLAVAEACSGIRSLLALLFLCVTYNYFFVPQRWIRAGLLGLVVPIAILCNAARILATGVVSQYNRELAHGMLHATFGYTALIIGSALLLLVHLTLKPRESRYA